MSKCDICPRECHADRDSGKAGVCGANNRIIVARTSLHMWEEPCVSGTRGSGTVFFSGCPLGCMYCQNYEISCGTLRGREYSIEELADSFIELQNKGANNINLVTPTHYSYQIIDSVRLAREKGLILPVVYNCSGYEKVDTLKALEGTVDVYLTDFKYMDDEIALKYSKAADYSVVAKLALMEMVRQQPECEFAAEEGALEQGIIKKGVIVRNLLLPGHIKNSKDVIKYVYETYGDSVVLSIMNQYTPIKRAKDLKVLDRKVTKREYDRLIDFVIDLGAENVYVQEEDASGEEFIPDFSQICEHFSELL